MNLMDTVSQNPWLAVLAVVLAALQIVNNFISRRNATKLANIELQVNGRMAQALHTVDRLTEQVEKNMEKIESLEEQVRLAKHASANTATGLEGVKVLIEREAQSIKQEVHSVADATAKDDRTASEMQQMRDRIDSKADK